MMPELFEFIDANPTTGAVLWALCCGLLFACRARRVSLEGNSRMPMFFALRNQRGDRGVR